MAAGRSSRLTTALTLEEKSVVVETAKSKGVSPSEFMRHSSVSASAGMSPAERYLAAEIAEVRRMIQDLIRIVCKDDEPKAAKALVAAEAGRLDGLELRWRRFMEAAIR